MLTSSFIIKDIFSTSSKFIYRIFLGELYDIVDTAIANGNFKNLVIALDVAGLVLTLKQPGPFTVFAPTDAAFAKLPPGALVDLLRPENRVKLVELLEYHVVSGNYTAASIIALNPPVRIPTLAGESFLVTKDGDKLKVDNATVIIADVFATNGIIHAIDEVLLPPPKALDIVDTAIANGNFKDLVIALDVAGLVLTLKQPGPFTVFAPTDAAFAKLPPGVLVDLLRPENRVKLVELLEYHVVAGNYTAASIIALNPPVRIPTLAGESFLVTKDGNKLKVDNATVIIADVFATNGIIHAIDEVLLPPAKGLDIVDTAIANGNFKNLVIALEVAGLVLTLKQPGPFTVFAPTDAAFAKLPPGVLVDLLRPENRVKLVEILEYHVVAGNYTAASIIALNPPVRIPTLAGESFLVTKDGDKLKVDNATVIIADVFATNGIIHAIDEVLLPPPKGLDIVDTAIDNGNFKDLVIALEVAGLVLTLKQPGPFTVFAPTDAAFAKLPPGVLVDLLRPENRVKLVEILEYHVVSGNYTAASIIALNPPVRIPTLAGESFLVTKDGNKLKVDNATVIIADVFATNGIIHAIDEVLLPPPKGLDIVDTAIDNGNFKDLVIALEVAGLVLTLKQPGPFTVFAPTDAAFAKLPPGTLVDLLRPENRVKLVELLEYHVVSGNYTAASIIALNPPVRLETLAGQSVLVTLNGTLVIVNDATVIVPNVFATNGIIHAIDTVLMPRLIRGPRRLAAIANRK